MIIDIDIFDTVSPMLQNMLEHNERYLRAVGKSVGWYAQREIKKGIASGKPGGSAFEERIPYAIRKALSKSAKEAWFGSLVKAVGYEYQEGTVKIGWTSKSGSAYGKIQEQGLDRVVTSNMRKYWASIGYPLRPETTVLEIPKRPIFEPMSKVLKKEIPSYVEIKLNSYLQENVEFGNKNAKRRKYKVYG